MSFSASKSSDSREATKAKEASLSETSDDDSLKEELKKLKQFKNQIKAKMSQNKEKQTLLKSLKQSSGVGARSKRSLKTKSECNKHNQSRASRTLQSSHTTLDAKPVPKKQTAKRSTSSKKPPADNQVKASKLTVKSLKLTSLQPAQQVYPSQRNSSTARHSSNEKALKTRSKSINAKSIRRVESVGVLSQRSLHRSSLKRSLGAGSQRSISDLQSQSRFYLKEEQKYQSDLKMKQMQHQVAQLKQKVADQQKELVAERQKSTKLQDMVEKLISKLRNYYQHQQIKDTEAKAAQLESQEMAELQAKYLKSEEIRKQQKQLIYAMRKEMQSK